MFRILAILCSMLLLSYSAFAQTNLVAFGSSWRYLDNGSNQGTNWRSATFKDTKWKIANGKFGYGISDATTTISFGSNASKKYITTYFRKTISIVDPAAYASFTFNIKRDDGAVVYLNGKEVYRSNMPTGNVSYNTLAKESTDHGATPQSFSISTAAFLKGVNIIAVEIHQAQANTPDMAFDLELMGIEKSLPKDLTPPTVISINRQGPTSESTSAPSITFRVSFSEKVTGVDVTDFAATTSGTASGSVSSIEAVGTTGGIYDLTLSAVSGEGTIRLDLKETETGIIDVAGNALSGGYTSGQSYSLFLADLTPPTVMSINRLNPITEPTDATSVTFRVAFSEAVTGVDATDFAIVATSGTVNGTVASNAIAAGADGVTYDVDVSAISGTGTLRLDLKSSGTGIKDKAGNAISGGFVEGETVIIQQPEPVIEQPKVLYYEGFESGTGFTGMNIQTSTTYGFNVIGNPTYQDLKVGRWELRAGDPPASNGTRAEVLFSADLAQQETWHSFVGYFPSADNLIDTDDEAFNQWHQGSSFGRPMMTFRTENGRFEVLRRSPDGLKTNYYIMGSIIYDQWLQFVIHIKQHLTDGIMQVWINGELKMDFRGPTMFDGPIGRWKMGIYKSSWNNGAKTNSIKRVWYVDEVRVGNAASTYESIKPNEGNNLKQLIPVNNENLYLKASDQQLDTGQSEHVDVYPTLAKRGSPIILNTNSSKVTDAFVSDITGRLIYIKRFTEHTSIETTYLPSGIYFISLTGERHARKHKFIITN